MHLTKIPLSKTHAFSNFFLDYIQQNDSLKPFYNRFPVLENFKGQLLEKQQSFPDSCRDVLVSVLKSQYKDIQITEAVSNNVKSLGSNKTFTVTTGHQLNIFTGPLYFIYKIVTVINTCTALKKTYPDFNFVPVYWMASEDHDYDEIKSFRLYEKKYVWETTQQGAVGRFSTQGLETLLDKLPGDVTLFRNAYLKNRTLSDAVRHYVNELFGHTGLVVIDADSRELKSLFKEVIQADILEHTTKKLVDNTNIQLESLGYGTQVYCRDINFFYLEDHLRSRIEERDTSFNIIDSDISFDRDKLLKAIDTTPEKFSPNVILRPLYQETILPNLAYVGGPAEVVYWLQLKEVFHHFKTPLPILLPRNFALVIEQHIMRKYEKTGLTLTDLFEEKNFLFNHWTLTNSAHDLSVNTERLAVENLFDQLKQRAGNIDPTLAPFVGAEGKRTLNSIEKIERKMLRAEKRIQREKLNQIESVKDILFPNGHLQERTDNFLNFYQQDTQFINMLIATFDPFDFQFNVIVKE